MRWLILVIELQTNAVPHQVSLGNQGDSQKTLTAGEVQGKLVQC